MKKMYICFRCSFKFRTTTDTVILSRNCILTGHLKLSFLPLPSDRLTNVQILVNHCIV